MSAPRPIFWCHILSDQSQGNSTGDLWTDWLERELAARLAVEQATRAEEDARLRELYPLPEDEEELDYGSETAAGEELGLGEPAVDHDAAAEASELSEASSADGTSEDPAR